ncbi:MAG TPA: TlpA disulfide reductase family protein [Candidatus Dormibacteraeota bacterium]|nr:TlpA disulfide reductase family protein [Candidatus Dormibacteraeota bacterium]
MRLKLSPLALLAIALLAAFTVFITWQAKKLEAAMRDRAEEPELINKAAPAFDLPALDGQRISLADYHGKKKLVVSFWASWCGPCKMEMPVLREFYEQQKKNADKFELLAISIDDEREPAEQFASEMKLPFPVLLDLQSQAAGAYGVDSIPSLFIIDENGKVIYGHTGFDPSLELVLATRLGLKPVPRHGGADDGDSSD